MMLIIQFEPATTASPNPPLSALLEHESYLPRNPFLQSLAFRQKPAVPPEHEKIVPTR